MTRFKAAEARARLLTAALVCLGALGGAVPAVAQASGGGLSSPTRPPTLTPGGAAELSAPGPVVAPDLGPSAADVVVRPSPNGRARPRAARAAGKRPVTTSLAGAFQGASRRNAALASFLAQRARFEAEFRIGQGLLPRAPVIGAGVRSDRAFRDRGSREFEASIDVPIWLPGEGTAISNVARAELARLDARIAAQNLVVTGEVREAYWKAANATGVIEIAGRRIAEAEEVAADMVRRVAAGEAQQADLLLARADVIEARTQRQEAEIAAREATLAFDALTGVRLLPAGVAEPARRERPVREHPRLVALDRTIEVAQAGVRVARLQMIDNPTVGAFLRNERDERGTPSNTSAGVRLSVPLPSVERTNAKVAAALSEVSAAQAEYGAAERAVRSEIEIARVQLAAARAQADLAEQRFQALTAQVELVRRAFRAGEIALPDYLRQRNALLAAEVSRIRTRLAVPQAVSKLNQALGYGL